MAIDFIHSAIGYLKQLFFEHKHSLREKAEALSRRMIAGSEESEKKPSYFLNSIKSFKDTFWQK